MKNLTDFRKTVETGVDPGLPSVIVIIIIIMIIIVLINYHKKLSQNPLMHFF